ncbi:CPBP family intramembrane metalloprotease [Panacibacter ginsenosidivorans]|uniref:CPBP family intramembrane metalloprotease n=1 Tax=Panacibacter ginsenosidivorans TaxID=1813871 RepID=A0A5B8V9M0_9BACT|nr:CPBP family intramembrane glutamic endopeptidase [Panacibacter ginsenosidivorans]QEC67416.1 CPBP family intramembrane metalloprotease [Panacibacter ginsenosidivorans]
MSKQINLYNILHFFLIKIIIGIFIVGGSVVLSGELFNFIFDKTGTPDDIKNLIITIPFCVIALLSYIFLFRFYEKREIKELQLPTFTKNAIIGFLTGLFLQTLFILVIYFAGGYKIIRVNPFSFLFPSFLTALAAGFVAEILIRGIFFRLAEEKLGTINTLLITTILFAVIHSGSNHATFLSVCATSMQAGVLLSAAFIFSRNLWVPIFLHFAWDFAEPGIFGAINPGNSIEQSLFTNEITGPVFITGGQTGPQNSIQSLLLCAAVSLLFLWLAKRKNNILLPAWKRKNTETKS